MIKVFVVDDEVRQRNSIVKHIQWNNYNMIVTGEAENAQQAIGLAKIDPPDLLITDIRMIGMDGLELSSHMRTINNKMHIIMVTGFEEFEYAKSAVDLGVESFLVKPIDFKELEKVLEQISVSQLTAIERLKEESLMKEQLRELMPIAREKLLQELINGLIRKEDNILMRSQYLGMFESSSTYMVILVAADHDKEHLYTREEDIQFIQLKIKRIAQNVFNFLLEEITTTSHGDIVLIIKGNEQMNSVYDISQKLEIFRSEVEKEISCQVSIGIGPEVDALYRITESLKLAQRAVNQRLLLGPGQTIYWQDIGEKSLSSRIEIENLVKDFLEALQVGESISSKKLIEEIVHCLVGSANIKEGEMRSICLELVSGASRVVSEMDESLNKHFDSEKVLWKLILECDSDLKLLQETIRILKEFCDLISERKKSHYRVIVKSALEYIGNHYSEDLSLYSVAEKVYLSVSYLGAIFRTELGQSFTDYLTSFRIKKAKELLKDPLLKIYEISESVGYQNPTYFCSVFRRLTGVTPKEFRNTLNIIDNE